MKLYAATRKGLFILERQHGSWRTTSSHFIGEPVTMVLPDQRSGRLYAALNLGHFGVKLHVSPDNGASWKELDPPAYPQRTPEEQAAAQEAGDKTPWSLVQIWCLEEGGADHPERLWCGTIPGGLFRSDDGGESWRLNRPLWDEPERSKWMGGGYDHPGIHSICLDPRDSERMFVGVSVGGVWYSGDGGESWEVRGRGMYAEYMPPESRDDPAVQDPHRIALCRSQPDALWSQHHNGVFRTVDGGRNWTSFEDVPPSKFGFAVAVHPEDPDIAWLAPAVKDECRVPVDGRFVVTRTRDGGRTFEQLDRGLPTPPAYDLVFRHCLEVDSQGEVLALGSTTGGLWISENQGDCWECVSAHLPPVYALRFAT